MENAKEDLSLISTHIFSQASLRTTAELINNFNFKLLQNPDISIRKISLLSLFLLIGRPRLPGFLLQVTKLENKDKKGCSPFMTLLPGVVREDKVFLSIKGSSDEDLNFQLEATRLIRTTSQIMSGHLFVYCNSMANIPATIGAIDLTMIKIDSNLQTLVNQLPDPNYVKILAPLSPHWDKIAEFIYIRIGCGEEELPSSSSCSISRSSSAKSMISKSLKPLDEILSIVAEPTTDNNYSISDRNQPTFAAGLSKKINIVPKLALVSKTRLSPRSPSPIISKKGPSNHFRLKIANHNLASGMTLSPSQERQKYKTDTLSPRKNPNFIINKSPPKKSNSIAGLKKRISQKLEIQPINISQHKISIRAGIASERIIRQNNSSKQNVCALPNRVNPDSIRGK